MGHSPWGHKESDTTERLAHILIPKPEKDDTRKEKHGSILLMSTDTKVLNKNLANQILQHIKRINHHDQVRSIYEMQGYLNTCRAKSVQFCPARCNHLDCSPASSSVHGILQVRTHSPCGLPWPPPGGYFDPGIEPTTLMSPALAAGFWTTSATWKAPYFNICKSTDMTLHISFTERKKRIMVILIDTEEAFDKI